MARDRACISPPRLPRSQPHQHGVPRLGLNRRPGAPTLLLLGASLASLTVCTAAATAFGSDEGAGTGPRFLTKNCTTLRATVGDTVTLPCSFITGEGAGGAVPLWRKGAAVLTASSLKVSRDERISLTDGYNLRIKNISTQDAGNYVCQLSDRTLLDLVHTLEVWVPAAAKPHPPSGRLAVHAHDDVHLECRASGNPVPHVTWTKLRNGGGGGGWDEVGTGQSLRVLNVTRVHAGRYRCTVSNAVGAPVIIDFHLTVQHAPEITVRREWRGGGAGEGGAGYTALLICSVAAEPRAQVWWERGGAAVRAGGRFALASHQDNHTLGIQNVRDEDFGNYTCVAENVLGVSRAHLSVSGRPGPARFTSPALARSPTSYRLAFLVDSYLPLQEVRILYRELFVNGSMAAPRQWHDSMVPPSEGGAGPAGDEGGAGPYSHRVEHRIRGLRPGTVYETIVQAKNMYGWNEVSDVFQFHTPGGDLGGLEADVTQPEYATGAAPSYAATPSLLFAALALVLGARRHTAAGLRHRHRRKGICEEMRVKKCEHRMG